MREAGLEVREDTVGNIYGRLPGSDPSAGAVVTGSHCDAIPLAGECVREVWKAACGVCHPVRA